MGTSIREVVAGNIRQIREAKGLSQSKLAQKCKLSVRFINRAETQPQNLTIESIETLAKGLGVSVADLVYDQRKKMPPPDRGLVKSIEQVVQLLEAYKEASVR
jgi:XRE family transcriptional regulator, regulator of sulfur utilization